MDASRWPLGRTLAVSAGAALAVLAIAVRAGWTAEPDLTGIQAIQSLANDTFDVLANAHTVTGQLAITLPLAVVLAILVWRREGGLIWIAPLFILVTGAIELALKLTTGHPPPGEEFDRAFGNPLGIRVVTPSAFPSGHVARIAFLALLAGAMFPVAWLRLAFAGYVAFTLFARVYIGDHWPSDVLGGLALGIFVGALALQWRSHGAALVQSAASKSSFARRK